MPASLVRQKGSESASPELFHVMHVEAMHVGEELRHGLSERLTCRLGELNVALSSSGKRPMTGAQRSEVVDQDCLRIHASTNAAIARRALIAERSE
jgi:hypothetical protein